ncbi:helicase-like protein [Pisolithus tinctorius]|nr:helicase-like protein [Pisolithus tinctorius]
MSLDFLPSHGQDEVLSHNCALQEISVSLEEHGRYLPDFSLPQPVLPSKTIISAATTYQALFAFVNGRAGRGKTFLVNTICNHLRAISCIVLPTSTSAFATHLYPGRSLLPLPNILLLVTLTTSFQVQVNKNNEMLQWPIQPGTPCMELIRNASLIIWDEAPMANYAILVCVNKVCCLLMDHNAPFVSPLWGMVTVFCLTIPICNADDPDFACFVNTIGDGAGPEICLDILQNVPSAEDLIKHIFPPMHAILCPTNSTTYLTADSLKEASDMGIIPPQSMLDYVASNCPPGLPPHALPICCGGVYCLMWNFSIDQGLVKNCHVVIISTSCHLITVCIILGSPTSFDTSDNILIPQITFTSSLHSRHTLQCSQFPLAPAYATMFNSCQGLMLDAVGVDLTRPVFSHRQLYTVLSCICHQEHA